MECDRHLVFEGLGGQGVVLGGEYGVTKEAIQGFQEVADRKVAFRGRDGQPPGELVDDEGHGVHAGLRRGFLEYLGRETHGGCVHIGREHMRGKGGVVDDGWDVGMEGEKRMNGDGPIRERERCVVVLGRGARSRRVARGGKRRLRVRRRGGRLGGVKDVVVIETDLFSWAGHLASCGCDATTTAKGSLNASLETKKKSRRVRIDDDGRCGGRFVIAG